MAKHLKHGGKISIVSKFVSIKTKNDLSIAYTPGVAVVSSHLAKNPKDAKKYSIKGNTIAIVSDGSAVLSLGNIGPLGALPVMEGKALLFKEFANVDAFPIVLNTQDPKQIIKITKTITNKIKIKAAQAIANHVPKSQLNPNYIIPSVLDKSVAKAVAKSIK